MEMAGKIWPPVPPPLMMILSFFYVIVNKFRVGFKRIQVLQVLLDVGVRLDQRFRLFLLQLHLARNGAADGEDDAEGQAETQEGGVAVADQRQGLARHRADVGVDEHVQEGLAGDEQAQSRHGELGVEVLAAVARDQRTARQQRHVQENDEDGAQQTVFFDDEAEHIVLGHVRNDVALGALSGALAQYAAFLYGYLGAVRLAYLVQGFVIGV